MTVELVDIQSEFSEDLDLLYQEALPLFEDIERSKAFSSL